MLVVLTETYCNKVNIITSNLAVRTLTIYQYIAHKRNSFDGIPKFYFIVLAYFCLSLR